MTVTTGGRGSASPPRSPRLQSCSSSRSFSCTSLGIWPISSTTSAAVSWSMRLVDGGHDAQVHQALMTSVALTAMRCASSATVMVSPMATSRITGAVGISKPCFAGCAADGRAGRAFGFFLRLPALVAARRAVPGGRTVVRASPSRPSVSLSACFSCSACCGAPRAARRCASAWPSLRSACTGARLPRLCALRRASSSALRRRSSSSRRRCSSAARPVRPRRVALAARHAHALRPPCACYRLSCVPASSACSSGRPRRA